MNRPALPLQVQLCDLPDVGTKVVDANGVTIPLLKVVELVNQFPELVNRAFPEGSVVKNPFTEAELEDICSAPPVVPMSLRAFGSPDALGSYCINRAHKEGVNEWKIAYDLLYSRAPQERQ